MKGQRGKGGGGIGPEEALVASTLSSKVGDHGYSHGLRGDGSDNLVAATLSSGSHPESNQPGRRREDDENLVMALDTYNQTVSGESPTLRDPNGTFGDALPAVAYPLEASDGHHGYSSPRGDGADNLIAEDVTGFSHTQGIDAQPSDEAWPSLRKGGHGHAVAMNLRGREEGARAEFSDAASLRAASDGSSRSHVGTEAAVRRLTPVECERLQGFPDNWTDPTGTEPDSRRYAALGDAVTVNVAHWVGLRIAAAEE